MSQPNVPSFAFADLGLSRRLERCEARSNLEFVEARAGLFPASNACWIEAAGAFAMFDGPLSPLTQTFGLGLFSAPKEDDLHRVEVFYSGLGAPVFHEVSPLADPSLLAMLSHRGYRPIELTSVLYHPLGDDHRAIRSQEGYVTVRLAQPEELDLWARTAARGWSQAPEFASLMEDLATVSARRPGALSFFAEIDGTPIATGSMTVWEGVALLAGASTIPEGRRQGAQLALLEARLRYAARLDCDTVMMCALPGSASQRNAERQGFRVAYTRIKWKLADSV